MVWCLKYALQYIIIIPLETTNKQGKNKIQASQITKSTQMRARINIPKPDLAQPLLKLRHAW